MQSKQSPFIWQNDYATGNVKIDEQHKTLFALANTLIDSETTEQVKRQAMLLFKHTREHFQKEEQELKEAGYPDYEQHVASHNTILDKLVNLSGTIHEQHWNRELLEQFMRSWANHICEEDMAARRYLEPSVKP